nr:hypothetical protein [Rhabdochromatium marinum]
MADYNAQYGTNHSIGEFDGYYQDVQQRIKDQQYPNSDLPHRQYLNTLYVDKNLKHHGLIQALSRTNRVLNDTKPYGHIFDFRAQGHRFVLFSSALIDYDYIMALIACYRQEPPGKETLSRDQIVSLLCGQSNLMDERDEIIAYIDTLQAGKGHGGTEEIKGEYQVFKANKSRDALTAMAVRHDLAPEALHGFVEGTLDRMIFDGEALTELFAPLELGWKARSQAETALMAELVPVLKKQAGGREISGLAAYEH